MSEKDGVVTMQPTAFRPKALRMALLAAAVGLIAACGQVTPVAYAPIDEIPPGPGLFSGEEGAFTLYRR